MRMPVTLFRGLYSACFSLRSFSSISIISTFLFLLLFSLTGWTDTHYVNKANSSPVSPFTNGWGSAATQIQDAIDQVGNGDLVLVTNGVYDSGGRSGLPNTSTTNRVTLTNSVTVLAVSTNPADTLIVGAPDMTGGSPSNGPAAVRCAYVGTGCMLAGFTLTNGYAGDAQNGGGVYGQSTGNGSVSNCVIVSCNATSGNGGGAFQGLLIDCIVRGCSAGNFFQAGGGGCRGSSAINCLFTENYGTAGGGVSCGTGGGSFSNCTIIGNNGGYGPNVGGYRTSYNYFINCQIGGGIRCDYRDIGNLVLSRCVISGYSGGGWVVEYGVMFNCLIVSNITSANGVLSNDRMINCTIVSNTCAAGYGAITATCISTNSIIYGNIPYDVAGLSAESNCYYSCIGTNGSSTSHVAGNGNVYNVAPKFVNPQAGDFHLESAWSPCFNSGVNQDWMTNAVDFDGKIRIRHGQVDMGAYELWVKTGTIFRGK